MNSNPITVPIHLSHLDDEQRQVVVSKIGAILVHAGPGAGKTRIIVERIAYLISNEKIDPTTILALTFTKKAANEMKDRVIRILSMGQVKNDSGEQAHVHCCTFHSFCHTVLKTHGQYLYELPVNNKASAKKKQKKKEKNDETLKTFQIKSESECMQMIQSIMETTLRNQNITEDKYNSYNTEVSASAVAGIISKAKNNRLTAQEFSKRIHETKYQNSTNEKDKITEEVAAQVYLAYEEQLHENQAIDFDDLLWKTYELFQQKSEALTHYANKYKHVIVDEYQDTNELQFLIIKMLMQANGGDSILAVGDSDQGIFSWRGADHKQAITYFRNSFPKCQEVILTMNYRSTRPILGVANHIINQKKDTITVKKHMKAQQSGGTKVWLEECATDQDEAYFIIEQLSSLIEEDAEVNQTTKKEMESDESEDCKQERFCLDNCAVLYRSTIQSRVLEQKLMESHIPYRLVGHVSFFNKPEVQVIINYIKVLINTEDSEALATIINVPKRKIGKEILKKLQNFAEQTKLSLFEVCQRVGESNGSVEIKKIKSKNAKIKVNVTVTNALRKLVADIRKVQRMKDENQPILHILAELISCIQYKEYLFRTDKRNFEQEWANVNELLRMAREEDTQNQQNTYSEDAEDGTKPLPPLIEFLEKLKNERSDRLVKRESMTSGTLVLSTIHAAKGLEWDNVFVIGCAMGLLPHYRALQSVKNWTHFRSAATVTMDQSGEGEDLNLLESAEIEEERRLAFVAVTRAKKRLYLSYAKWKINPTIEMALNSQAGDNSNVDNYIYTNSNTLSPFFTNLPNLHVQYNYLSTTDHTLITRKQRKNIFVIEKKPKINDTNNIPPPLKKTGSGFISAKELLEKNTSFEKASRGFKPVVPKIKNWPMGKANEPVKRKLETNENDSIVEPPTKKIRKDIDGGDDKITMDEKLQQETKRANQEIQTFHGTIEQNMTNDRTQQAKSNSKPTKSIQQAITMFYSKKD